MYHSSLFEEIPKGLCGVYVLRRSIKKPKGSKTRDIDRVAVVGSSMGVNKRLQQYFVELTATALHPNVRNAASVMLDSITHVDVYVGAPIKDDITVMAAELVLTESYEPIFRQPRQSNNISQKAQLKAQDQNFRRAVNRMDPVYTVEIPNMDTLRRRVAELTSTSESLRDDNQILREQLSQLSARIEVLEKGKD